MKNNSSLLQCVVFAGGLALCQTPIAQGATPSEPTAAEPVVPEPAEPERRFGPAVREGPVPGGPFTPITPPGDPFGFTSSPSALASGIPSGASGIRLGPATLYPALGVAQTYDDNINASNVDKKSSFATVLTPAVMAEVRGRGGNLYRLGYRADLTRYWDTSENNNNRQQVVADANLIITTRARLSLMGEYSEAVQQRGTTDRPGGAEPDKSSAKSVSGLYAYGAPGARGRIEVEAGRQATRYLTNRAVTAAADYDTTFVGGAFFWRVMPKTSLLFRVRQTDFDYRLSTVDLDSTQRQYAVGATWEATAQTTGSVSIGQVKKDFDAGTREDFTELFWEGAVRWSPRTYSTFDLQTAQGISETSGLGDVAVSRVVSVTWTHAWTSRTSSSMRVGYRNDSYRGTGVTRDDDTANVGAGLNYQFRRWLSLGAQYDRISRSSNDPANEYDKNVFMVTVGMTL